MPANGDTLQPIRAVGDDRCDERRASSKTSLAHWSSHVLQSETRSPSVGTVPPGKWRRFPCPPHRPALVAVSCSTTWACTLQSDAFAIGRQHQVWTQRNHQADAGQGRRSPASY